MKQTYGYTPANPKHGYTGYVAVHKYDNGDFEVVVRTHGSIDGHHGEMRLSPEEAFALSIALQGGHEKLTDPD